MTIFTGDPEQPKIEEAVGTVRNGTWVIKIVTRPVDLLHFNTSAYPDGSAYEFSTFKHDDPPPIFFPQNWVYLPNNTWAIRP